MRAAVTVQNRVSAALVLLSVALVLAASLTSTAAAARPGVTIPKKATFVGNTSQKHVAAIYVSHNGTRVGFTIWFTARCTDGTVLKGLPWSTEGKYAKDYFIRPKADGSFRLNDASDPAATPGGGRVYVTGTLRGRFKTARLVAGTMRGRVEYRSAAGRVVNTCDTGPLTWSARR